MDQKTHLARYRQVTEFLNELTAKKGADYAGPDNPFQNFTLIEIITSGRVSTSAGLLVRMTDKLQRFANLLAKPPAVTDESIDDTLLDLAGYSILAYLWRNAANAELALPGVPHPVDETIQQDFDNDVEVAASYPMDASPNTAEDAYRELAEKVEKYGPAALTPSENLLLKMIISAKLGAA
jgi:hypothetical protein